MYALENSIIDGGLQWETTSSAKVIMENLSILAVRLTRNNLEKTSGQLTNSVISCTNANDFPGFTFISGL